MVLINATTSSLAPAPCELKMESGRSIRYVAPLDANPRKETRCNYEEVKLTLRKNSLHDSNFKSLLCLMFSRSKIYFVRCLFQVIQLTRSLF
uniref:Uncharacterized protein n=1 Tax=Heterorhabditis bacteriophora TaxID=37862 RepID=A0A1I7WUN2_HETBA